MTASSALRAMKVSCFTIPTDAHESDGTFSWDETTIVVVEVAAGDAWGLGYTYCDLAAAGVIDRLLWPALRGADAMATGAHWTRMRESVRNVGSQGICAMAISALDCALWDLKARLLDTSLLRLLGPVRRVVPVYGSGGFTSYSDEQLTGQLHGWVQEGIPRVKMKVGRDPDADGRRVRLAREAIGPEPALFVDANGAYRCPQALAMARTFHDDAQVSWFEEPVSSDDLAGLRSIRAHVPAGMVVAAGEYGYDPAYFRRMIAAEAVDVVQVDITRCGGVTGVLAAAAVADANHLLVSGHCAPALHASVLAAVPNLAHLEYFHDHVRIEAQLFDGVARLEGGALCPDPELVGNGLTLKREEAARYAA